MSNSERIYFFDNVKAFLIILVVFGHLLEYFLHLNDIFKWTYVLIYSFHMPLFAFVSGFLSKDNNIKKTAPNILFQFLFYNILYAVFIVILFYLNPDLMEVSLSQIEVSGSISPIVTLLTPYWLMWYMLSLLFWRIMLVYFKKRPIFLVAAVIIGILFGFVDIYGRILSIQRTFSLFPFFLAGYFIDYEKIKDFTKNPYSKLLLIIPVIVLPPSYLFIDHIDVNIFYYSDSFKDLGYSNLHGALLRITLYTVSSLMGALFIILIPHNYNKYTDIGLNTLNIYILHGFIVQTLWALGFFPLLWDLPVLTVFTILIIITGLIIHILSNKHISSSMKRVSIKKKKGKD